MAEQTFLEAIGVLQFLGFEFFLVPLLVFTIMLGILQRYKVFTDKTDLNGFAALVIALFVALVPDASTFIFRVTPFFVAFLTVVFSMMMLFMFLGATMEDIREFMRKPFSIILIFVFAMVVSIYVASTIFGDIFVPESPSPNASDYTGNEIQVFANILAHPKVLGTIIFLLLLAASTFTIVYQIQ